MGMNSIQRLYKSMMTTTTKMKTKTMGCCGSTTTLTLRRTTAAIVIQSTPIFVLNSNRSSIIATTTTISGKRCFGTSRLHRNAPNPHLTSLISPFNLDPSSSTTTTSTTTPSTAESFKPRKTPITSFPYKISIYSTPNHTMISLTTQASTISTSLNPLRNPTYAECNQSLMVLTLTTRLAASDRLPKGSRKSDMSRHFGPNVVRNQAKEIAELMLVKVEQLLFHSSSSTSSSSSSEGIEEESESYSKFKNDKRIKGSIKYPWPVPTSIELYYRGKGPGQEGMHQVLCSKIGERVRKLIDKDELLKGLTGAERVQPMKRIEIMRKKVELEKRLQNQITNQGQEEQPSSTSSSTSSSSLSISTTTSGHSFTKPLEMKKINPTSSSSSSMNNTPSSSFFTSSSSTIVDPTFYSSTFDQNPSKSEPKLKSGKMPKLINRPVFRNKNSKGEWIDSIGVEVEQQDGENGGRKGNLEKKNVVEFIDKFGNRRYREEKRRMGGGGVVREGNKRVGSEVGVKSLLKVERKNRIDSYVPYETKEERGDYRSRSKFNHLDNGFNDRNRSSSSSGGSSSSGRRMEGGGYGERREMNRFPSSRNREFGDRRFDESVSTRPSSFGRGRVGNSSSSSSYGRDERGGSYLRSSSRPSTSESLDSSRRPRERFVVAKDESRDGRGDRMNRDRTPTTPTRNRNHSFEQESKTKPFDNRSSFTVTKRYPPKSNESKYKVKAKNQSMSPKGVTRGRTAGGGGGKGMFGRLPMKKKKVDKLRQ